MIVDSPLREVPLFTLLVLWYLFTSYHQQKMTTRNVWTAEMDNHWVLIICDGSKAAAPPSAAVSFLSIVMWIIMKNLKIGARSSHMHGNCAPCERKLQQSCHEQPQCLQQQLQPMYYKILEYIESRYLLYLSLSLEKRWERSNKILTFPQQPPFGVSSTFSLILWKSVTTVGFFHNFVRAFS